MTGSGKAVDDEEVQQAVADSDHAISMEHGARGFLSPDREKFVPCSSFLFGGLEAYHGRRTLDFPWLCAHGGNFRWIDTDAISDPKQGAGMDPDPQDTTPV